MWSIAFVLKIVMKPHVLLKIFSSVLHAARDFTLFLIITRVVLVCRDLVHRQTACAAIKHMALGVAGFGCEDALTHLVNYVWPNIFETSPHVINAVLESIEGMRVALGPSRVLHYCLQVCNLAVKTYNGSQFFLSPFMPLK